MSGDRKKGCDLSVLDVVGEKYRYSYEDGNFGEFYVRIFNRKVAK